ncbi:hypothetical protein SAY86_001040 [Trapa natans]|uniref:EF-hand domain-containing protein n=1 Tax=Trapa natans TaxID=22666 RepID=A0AAN7MQC9_TRANT|nr:hypothetical protein SAY86_001040 [Trapa natans]
MPRARKRRSSPSGSSLRKEVRDDDSGSPTPSKGLSEYEIQRMSRIAENRKRMAALGLPQITRSLTTGSGGRSSRKSNSKGKRKLDDEDEDYEPQSGGDSGVNDRDYADDDEEDKDYSAPASNRKKVKRKSIPIKKSPGKKVPIKSDSFEDDLMQAIGLSLGKVKDCSQKVPPRRMEVSKGSLKGKSKTSFNNRVKMTEDELVMHFFQLDEEGKGSINMKDLAKVAIAHNFTWTDDELFDMIQFFDTDGDGKLSLDDFRMIAERCNMIQG